MYGYACDPSSQEGRQENCHEFKADMGYRVSLRLKRPKINN